VSTVFLMSIFRTCCRPWWRAVGKGVKRYSAPCTVLTFLTLLGLAGPHRAHHLVEQHPQHDHKHSHDDQAQQSSDCPMLFLIQHTPIAERWGSPLTAPLLVAELIVPALSLRICVIPQHVFQARAPPSTFLLTYA
jgi:hypothetical protein